MRFKEFNLRLYEFAPPIGTGGKVSELLDILNNPEASRELKKKVHNLFSMIFKPKQGEPMGRPAAPIAPQSNDQAVSESVEDTLTPEQRAEAEKKISTDPALKAYFALIQKQARQEGFTTGTALSGQKTRDQQRDEFRDDVTAAVSKLSQLSADIKTVVISECFKLWGGGEDSSNILEFLNQCATTERVINLPEIINGRGKSLLDPGSPYFKIMTDLASLNPGQGHSASGQGEWALVLAGAATKKISPGDIEVSGLKVEVKASATKPGKSSLSDFTFSKLPVEKAKKIMMDTINASLGANTITAVSAINNKTLNEKLNPMFQKMGAEAVKTMLRKMWKAVIPEDELSSYIEDVVNIVDPNGTISLEKVKGPTATLAAAQYQNSNKHDRLLLLHVPTLSCTVIADPKEMAHYLNIEKEITMTSIFDFREKPGGITFKRPGPPKIKKTKSS
jgi:hypothetical protein